MDLSFQQLGLLLTFNIMEVEHLHICSEAEQLLVLRVYEQVGILNLQLDDEN